MSWGQGRKRADFRANYLDKSTRATYRSGFNSYLTFCKLHRFDIEPTPDRLSLFVAYMARQTDPLGKPVKVNKSDLRM